MLIFLCQFSLSISNVYFAGPHLEPLSAPQPTFEHVFEGGRYTFSNCSLLHKLLVTGQEEQVVSRRGELNRDLLSSTCEFKDPIFIETFEEVTLGEPST